MKDVSQTNNPTNLELRRNNLFLRCAYDATGRLCFKFERVGEAVTEYEYAFDAAGHLTRVTRNGALCEEYRYNQAGQRIAQRRTTPYGMSWETELLHYDALGRLTSAGDVGFEYSANGALVGRYTQHGFTAFSYGQDTRLDMAVLSTKATIRYEYAGIHPVRRYRYLTLTGEYVWEGDRLVTFFNHELQLEYSFRYAESGVPGVVLDTVTLRPLPPSRRQRFPKDIDWAKECADWLHGMSAESQRQRLWAWLESWHQFSVNNPLTLYAGCDQVGTLRVLTDKFGRVVKDVHRDSFGVLLEDSFPDLFMPLGFAGGLEDPSTGLVRLGWRDYDPSVGRFTAPDPVRDRRGDGDIYDYCVDNPVSRVDPTGLAFSQAAAVAGGKSHGGVSHPFGASHGQSTSNSGGKGGGDTDNEHQLDALAGGRLVAAAAQVGTATDAGGGKPSPEVNLPQPVRDAARLLERPLDFSGGEWLQKRGLPHEQFVFDTGENFGKMSDGEIRADDPKNMSKYTQVDPRTFKGKYVREAQRELADERAKIEEMYEKIKELPLSDNMPHSIPAYNAFIDNCLFYSGKVIRRAKKLAEDAGDTLTQ